jgi:hypothetical protein
MIFLSGKASRGSRNPKQVATECVIFSLIATVCFAGEFFSVGFAVFGQICALFVPWLIANSRGFKGVDKTLAMAHKHPGSNGMRPITVPSAATTPTSTSGSSSSPSVWTSIDQIPSPSTSSPAASSPSASPSSDPSKPFPAFPNYIPPTNDTPSSTDS